MNQIFPRLVLSVLWVITSEALAPSAVAAEMAPDYGKAANWICRPGNEGSCTGGLDALTVTADGTRTVQKFAPLEAPAIDCFYVYPTVSEEPTHYSDLILTPRVADVVHDQAGRLTARCRVFAPIYRQLTEAGLRAVLDANGAPDWNGPYEDVLAAWRWYMAHDNHGRGVVLIGHSQGTILLQRLLAEQIDGQKAQQQLVAAFLAGDLQFPVVKNAEVGGLLKHIPLCTEAAQTGCVYVWNSYLAGDNAPHRIFGKNPAGPLVAACDNPAAPGAGIGELRAYFHRPRFAPDSDPPWVDIEGQLSAQCVADAQGNVLRVTIQPTRFAGLLRMALRGGPDGDPGGWGLHVFDVELTLGNVLERIAQETATWLRDHPTRAQ